MKCVKPCCANDLAVVVHNYIYIYIQRDLGVWKTLVNCWGGHFLAKNVK